MTIVKNTIALALAAAVIGASGTVVHAASQSLQLDLPILVDRYYEIKNPAGPVTAHVVPEALKQKPEYFYELPDMNIEDIPNPQWDQQILMQR